MYNQQGQGGYPPSSPYNGSAPSSHGQPPPYSPNFPPGDLAPAQAPYPQGGNYPPQPPGPQSGYPPQPPGSQGGYPPQPPGAYVPQAPGQYMPPGQGYGGYPQPQGGYVPPGYVPPGYQPVPITQQPGHGPLQQSAPGGWMNIPQGLANCPPGLEYLSMIDQLLVHQKVELLEALTGFETNNKFTIKNSIGQKVYYAVEDNDCLTRNCCGPLRPFEMKILDNYRNQVINMHRPLACDSCCFPCCLQSMEISSPPGTIIGFVEQEWSIFKPSFLVKNAAGEVMLTIKGPMCRFTICGDVEFQVLSKDGETVVGKISKQWSGMLREMFTDADYFGITFPMDLDVRMKAVLLGACFLIDAMFFEKSNNQERDGLGMI